MGVLVLRSESVTFLMSSKIEVANKIVTTTNWS
jgi:hypothetical protein